MRLLAVVLAIAACNPPRPDLSGQVQVAWTVTSNGGVSNVQILANSTGNRDMEGCIERTIGGWSFPASRGSGVDIEYPFRFVPGG